MLHSQGDNDENRNGEEIQYDVPENTQEFEINITWYDDDLPEGGGGGE